MAMWLTSQDGKDLKWGYPELGLGFVRSHACPCEVWIDNIKVLHEDNCVKKYPGVPASIPVDYSKCKGTCILKFCWLALHEPKWEVHKNCVKIQNNASA
ncbi:hypothetical protein Poli38472_006179 [Pythium oligandrum]|uniref:Uncharacterized protein n=1 Tax=Pythium oligandrum TaxID=41045 RepID=A0A8K1CU73_PYTOL|nr:hypothetical protein Poli38472_006179 [Pythium oligandrum]|eukprot:TMW68711.1 hypothetical protein Poli38472_006179 [Pythium oligandrum]